jgi:hypothetical protein
MNETMNAKLWNILQSWRCIKEGVHVMALKMVDGIVFTYFSVL